MLLRSPGTREAVRGGLPDRGGGSRSGRLPRGGRLLQDGSRGGPVFRLLARWIRRPLLPAARLWRRNIQLRIVAGTLLMSLGVVLLLGIVVIGQVRNGLLDAKEKAAQSQAAGGFSAAQDRAATTPATPGQPDGGRDGASVNWRSTLVEQLASGGQSAFNVVALSLDTGDTASRGVRASGEVDPVASIPGDLRHLVAQSTDTLQKFTRIHYTSSKASEPGLVIGKRLNDAEGTQYELYYLFPLTQEEDSLTLVKGTLATAGLFVVVLLGAIAWLMVRQVVTPVRMAAGIAERLSAGRLQERMKVTGEDDIARLGEAFNKMAQNLQPKIQQLEELSRMQRRFVSDVSHELRTPLTTVRMAADVIHEARVDFDPVTARSAELLGDQLDRFESLLSDLLEISRFDAGAAALEAEPIDLRQVVRRVIGGAEPLAERKNTRIVVVGDQQPVVAEADARRVERVLRNLVVNAVEHGEGRDVVVKLAAAGGAVAVAVRDYGVGLKPGRRRGCSTGSGAPTRPVPAPPAAPAWACRSPSRTPGCTAAGSRPGASPAAVRSSGSPCRARRTSRCGAPRYPWSPRTRAATASRRPRARRGGRPPGGGAGPVRRGPGGAPGAASAVRGAPGDRRPDGAARQRGPGGGAGGDGH